MWYIAVAVGIAVAGTVAGYAKTRILKTPVRIMDRSSIAALSAEQIDFLLARLEREEAPEPVFGAMCYEMMAPPAVAEYICPVCGEKTLYHDYRTAFIEWELDGARRLAESIDERTEFQVSLDETLFCDFCSPEEIENPYMRLRVVHQDGRESLERVSLTDLRKISSFLEGRLYWVTDNDGQEPLKEDTERIRQLLGLTEE